jgi:hypothetical protein
MDLRPYLDDLESRINPETEEALLAQWRRFLTGKWEQDVFAPKRRSAAKGIEWPKVPVNRTLDDLDAMVIQQYGGCSNVINGEAGRVMAVRANYGVPILAMPFGCELFVMPEHMQSLPNCHPIGAERVKAWLDKGLPSVDHPYLQRVWAAGERYMQIKRQYPKIGKYVWIYHPDFQGPMDVLELIWGSDIFLAFVDEPETIHRLLTLITDFYIAAMKRWLSIVPQADPAISCHWGMLQPGQVMIRDDSAMNLPPAYFQEFIQPYDQRILNEFGGGVIHACGRVDHWSTFLAEMKGLRAFNMSQPHLNDMEKVLSDTVDKNVAILDLNPQAVRTLQSAGRKLHGRLLMF